MVREGRQHRWLEGLHAGDPGLCAPGDEGAREAFEEALEQELELLAEAWPGDTQAKELALAVDEERLASLLEDFGLGNDRS